MTKLVVFYGDKDCLKSWKQEVKRITNKKCGNIVQAEVITSTYTRYQFKAHINEDDCQKLMSIWYHTQPGQDLMWNHRVGFLKY